MHYLDVRKKRSRNEKQEMKRKEDRDIMLRLVLIHWKEIGPQLEAQRIIERKVGQAFTCGTSM